MRTFRSSFARQTPLPLREGNSYYAAVRHSVDGYDWIDASTISGDPECAAAKAWQMDTEIPQWATHNPLAAIVAVTLTVKELF